jgi:hypothetical protein
MAFIPLPQSQIAVGKPVREDLWQNTKDNLDDHETRVGGLEQGQPKTEVFRSIIHNPLQFLSGTVPQVLDMYQAPHDFNLVTAIVTNFRDGTADKIEIDVRVGATADPDTHVSVFSTLPSVTFGGGDFVESSNAVFVTQNITQGQWLSDWITSYQVGQKSFHFQCYGEVN